MRFNNVFTYEIRVNIDTPENIMVPPMLIQPYLENAIIHGLRRSTRPGHLLFEARETETSIYCTISDNGIGRELASAISKGQHQSTAMSNIEARLELLNMEFGMDLFSVVIKDLEKDGEPAGTEVTLCFPNDLH